MCIFINLSKEKKEMCVSYRSISFFKWIFVKIHIAGKRFQLDGDQQICHQSTEQSPIRKVALAEKHFM